MEERDQMMGWGCWRKSSERKRTTLASLPQQKRGESLGGEQKERQSRSLCWFPLQEFQWGAIWGEREVDTGGWKA